ncbi:hypothetical protein [Ekhidna sp.]
MLFEPKHYGNPISPKLANRILKYVSNYDMLEATKGTEIGSIDTMKAILYRQRNITERNADAIINLARIAFMRSTTEMELAMDTRDYFLDELNQNEEDIRNHVLNQIQPEALMAG